MAVLETENQIHSADDSVSVSADAPGGLRRFTRRAALSLLTFVLVNPIVLYAAYGDLAAALAVAAVAQALVQVADGAPGGRRPTAVTINACVLVSIFVHGDLLVTTRFPERVIENPYVLRRGYYFNRPFLNEEYVDKEFRAQYRTNAQGYRISATMDPNRQIHEVDWLFVGDSFTQGAQVDFEELFSTRIYRRFPDRIVLNVGVSGFGLAQEHAFLEREGMDLRPGLVVLQICTFNDFMNVVPRRRTAVDLLVHYSPFARLLLQDFKFPSPASLPLGRWAEPFHRSREENQRFNVFFRESSVQKEADLAAFADYLRQIATTVHAGSAELLVVLVPNKEQVDPRFLSEVLDGFALDPSDLDLSYPNLLLSKLARELDLPLIDLLPVFRDHPGEVFFRYDEHLTPLGHAVAADAIAAWMDARGYGSSVESLSLHDAGDRYPRPASDARWLFYQSPRDGNMELFVRDIASGEEARLTADDVDQGHPWPLPGTQSVLTTVGDPASLRTKVELMDLQGNRSIPLTPEVHVYGAIPAADLEGRRVAFATWQMDDRGNFSPPRIVVRDLLTGGSAYVTSGEREAWRPVFTPDGRGVVYIEELNEQFDLFLADLVTGEVERLTETPFDEWDPVVSSDGEVVVYAARAEGNWDLFALRLRDRVVERLTRTKGDEWDPAFSPDDRGILFAGEFGLFRGMYRLPRPHR